MILFVEYIDLRNNVSTMEYCLYIKIVVEKNKMVMGK